MKCKLYTAVGTMHIRKNTSLKEYPIVEINGKECVLDINEMTLWCVLNWRILSENETSDLFIKKQLQLDIDNPDIFNSCFKRLIRRGLISEGIGETEADALYDLLSGLYIIPISENILLKAASFIRLTLINKIPLSITKQIFIKDRRTENEKKVMKLANQALLSTAEIIKCFEDNHINFSSEKQIIDAIYCNELTTCDNITELSRTMSSCRSVLTSVANLLLRRQIILERI